MSENWGTIALRVSSDVVADLNESLSFSGRVIYPRNMLEQSGWDIFAGQTVRCISNYILLNFNCIENIEEFLQRQAKKNVEFYAEVSDEYGCNSYFAVTAKNERYFFCYDEDGDAFDIYDNYEEIVTEKINAWRSYIPESLKVEFSE